MNDTVLWRIGRTWKKRFPVPLPRVLRIMREDAFYNTAIYTILFRFKLRYNQNEFELKNYRLLPVKKNVDPFSAGASSFST